MTNARREQIVRKIEICESSYDGESALAAECYELMDDRDRLAQILRWIATVNTTIDLRLLDKPTLIGLIYELRGRAKSALSEDELK